MGATNPQLFHLSAGTTSQYLQSAVFSNSNGVSFGLNGNTITASVDAGGGGLTNIRVSGGTTSNLLSALTFGDANGISFGLNASTMTASHNALTTAAQSNHSHGNPTLNLTNLSGTTASNSAGFTLSLSAAGAGAADGVNILAAGTQTANTTGTVLFSNSNGITFGMSNSSVITAQHNALTTGRASNDAVGLNTALTAGPLAWTVNSAGISLNAGSAAGTSSGFTGGASISGSFTHNTAGLAISLSHPAWITTGALSNHSHGVSFTSGSVAFQTLSFTNSNGISFNSGTQGIFGSHNAITTGALSNHSHGNPTLNLTNLSGTTASASNGFTLSLSAAAPGAAAITQSIGMSTQTAGGATGGTTGYATGDDVLYHFVPGSNITMSQSVNGASATLSIYGPAAGGGATLSGYDGFANNEFLAIAGSQASLRINQLDLPCALQFDRVGLRITHSNATNSSGSATISAWVGFYTRNNSSLSLLASTSFSTGITQSGTVGSYSRYGGIKVLPIPWTTTFQASNYWVGIISRTTTGGANMTFGNLGNSQIASTMSGYFGSGSNATAGIRLAVGVYSATTSALPAAISITQINGNSSAFHRQPAYLFMSNIF